VTAKIYTTLMICARYLTAKSAYRDACMRTDRNGADFAHLLAQTRI